MSKCIKCGSYAFNLYKEGIDQGNLCDVHYWQGRANRAEAAAQPAAPTNYGTGHCSCIECLKPTERTCGGRYDGMGQCTHLKTPSKDTALKGVAL